MKIADHDFETRNFVVVHPAFIYLAEPSNFDLKAAAVNLGIIILYFTYMVQYFTHIVKYFELESSEAEYFIDN